MHPAIIYILFRAHFLSGKPAVVKMPPIPCYVIDEASEAGVLPSLYLVTSPVLKGVPPEMVRSTSFSAADTTVALT